MAHYCDSERLERNWFNWLLSTAVPDLEPFREAGLLWTRIPGYSNPALEDPKAPYREHCIALSTPHHLTSSDGKIDSVCSAWRDGKVCKLQLPTALLGLECDDPLLRLEEPYLQQGLIIPRLVSLGYRREVSSSESWAAMINDIDQTCRGISRKFDPWSEEERNNLANEALSQVMVKLKSRKLTYTPGLAPVFNLITTTIYRCMFSIKNRETKQRKCITKLTVDLRAGVLPRTMRSLRVPGLPTTRRRD